MLVTKWGSEFHATMKSKVFALSFVSNESSQSLPDLQT